MYMFASSLTVPVQLLRTADSTPHRPSLQTLQLYAALRLALNPFHRPCRSSLDFFHHDSAAN